MFERRTIINRLFAVVLQTDISYHPCCMFTSVIETLLCYLELHSKKWIENLQPIFAHCSIQFYGGRPQMLAVAKKVSCDLFDFDLFCRCLNWLI